MQTHDENGLELLLLGRSIMYAYSNPILFIITSESDNLNKKMFPNAMLERLA